jgi:hypothetical protein
MVRHARNQPAIREIADATVWDQRSDERDAPREGS